MPEYDADNFDPPAPIAYVILRDPQTGASIADVPMLIDTGADATALPRVYVDQLGVKPIEGKTYEAESFDGQSRFVMAVKLEMVFMERKFMGQFLLIDQPIGFLGRNILNNIPIIFDGPRKRWGEYKR